MISVNQICTLLWFGLHHIIPDMLSCWMLRCVCFAHFISVKCLFVFFHTSYLAEKQLPHRLKSVKRWDELLHCGLETQTSEFHGAESLRQMLFCLVVFVTTKDPCLIICCHLIHCYSKTFDECSFRSAYTCSITEWGLTGRFWNQPHISHIHLTHMALSHTDRDPVRQSCLASHLCSEPLPLVGMGNIKLLE